MSVGIVPSPSGSVNQWGSGPSAYPPDFPSTRTGATMLLPPTSKGSPPVAVVQDGSSVAIVRSPSAPTPLIVYGNGPRISEGNQAAVLMTSSGPSAHRKKRISHAVFYATLAVYGAFLAGVAGIMTLPAIGKLRGRIHAYSYWRGGAQNARYRARQRVAAFEFEKKSNLNGEHPLYAYESHRVPASERDKYGIPKRWISASNESAQDGILGHAEHEGWWERADKLFIGFHKKGASTFDEVTHPAGRVSLAVPQPPPENVMVNGRVDVRQSKLKESEYLIRSEAESALSEIRTKLDAETQASPESVSKAEPVIAFHADGGMQKFDVYHIAADRAKAVLAQIKHEHLLSKSPSNDFRNELLDKHRIDKDDDVLSARPWDVQFELLKKTPHAGSSSAKQRAYGQVVQRYREYFAATMASFRSAADAGNRTGLMLQSSTMLSSMLVFSSAVAALALLCYYEVNIRNPQNEEPDQKTS